MFIYNINFRLETQIISVIDLYKEPIKEGYVLDMLHFSALANGVVITKGEFEKQFNPAFENLLKKEIIILTPGKDSDKHFKLNF